MRVTGAKRNPKTNSTITVNASGSKYRIHNVFIIDASGSMDDLGKYTVAIDGVNELLKSINADTNTENTLTIVEFEGATIATRLDAVSILPSSYKGMGTGGMTPLNQAVGETLDHILSVRSNRFSKEDKILVNVFTDGGENSSKGKWANPIKLGEYIKELESKGVTVTFVGTQMEVQYAIRSLNVGVSNTLVHDNTKKSVSKAFNKTVVARQAYSASVSRGEDVTMNFYTKTVEDDETK